MQTLADEVVKRYLIFRKCPLEWTNRSKCNLEVTKRTGENCPLIEKKHLSGVKFRSAKCPDVWINRSGKTSDYSRGVVKCDGVSQHKAASACTVD